MRAFLPLLVLLAACAARPNSLDVPPVAARSLAQDLRVETLAGGPLDLGQELSAGRSLALVFWQSW